MTVARRPVRATRPSISVRSVKALIALAAFALLSALPSAARTERPAHAPERRGSEVVRGLPDTIVPENLFHTLAADYFIQNDGTIYVQTGDIPAMWSRDAAAQTLPYVRLARARPMLRTWIRAVIAREARNIDVDPYANAFRANYRIWERKWEVDSLAYPLLLAWTYEAEDDDRRVFSGRFHRVLARIVTTYECESRHANCSRYRFAAGKRDERGPAPEIGLIWSTFRPSDDATKYPYNVPEQMQAITALRELADLAVRGYYDLPLAARASTLARAVETGIAKYGVVYDFDCGGAVYAYEIDGLGRRVFFDDANIPSLLAAPLVSNLSIDDPLYTRTRACVLSKNNAYYYRGRVADGVGSPHTPRGFIWPLAMIARALTSADRREIEKQMLGLVASAGSDGLIHESFDPSDPRRFTRAEFGWANATYAELLFRTAADLRRNRSNPQLPASSDDTYPSRSRSSIALRRCRIRAFSYARSNAPCR